MAKGGKDELFETAVNAVMTGRKMDKRNAITIVAEYGPETVLDSMKYLKTATFQDLKGYKKAFLKSSTKHLGSMDEISQGAILTTIRTTDGNISVLFTKDGKLYRSEFEPKQLARLFGKSTDEVTALTKRSDVVDAAKSKAKELGKLGIAGSLTAGIVFLMLATGEMNPIIAIEKALEAAAEKAAEVTEAGGDVVANLLKKMFGSFKGFLGVSAMFIFISCVMVILWLLISVVLKK